MPCFDAWFYDSLEEVDAGFLVYDKALPACRLTQA